MLTTHYITFFNLFNVVRYKNWGRRFSIFVFVYYSQEVSSQLHLNYQNLCHCCKLTLSSSWFYLSGMIQVWPQRILGIFQGLTIGIFQISQQIYSKSLVVRKILVFVNKIFNPNWLKFICEKCFKTLISLRDAFQNYR